VTGSDPAGRPLWARFGHRQRLQGPHILIGLVSPGTIYRGGRQRTGSGPDGRGQALNHIQSRDTPQPYAISERSRVPRINRQAQILREMCTCWVGASAPPGAGIRVGARGLYVYGRVRQRGAAVLTGQLNRG
jgi:hypothetical protein